MAIKIKFKETFNKAKNAVTKTLSKVNQSQPQTSLLQQQSQKQNVPQQRQQQTQTIARQNPTLPVKVPSSEISPEQRERAALIAQGKSVGDFARDTVQALPRAVVSVTSKETRTPTGPLEKKILGSAPIKPIAQRVADNEMTLKDMGAGKSALPLAFAGTVASTALDLLPGNPLKGVKKKVAGLADDVAQRATQIARKSQNMPVNQLVTHEIAPDTLQIGKYADDIKAGRPVEPLKVIKEKGGYGVEDGKHRLAAYKKLGYNEVPVEVVPPKVKVNNYQDVPAKAKPTPIRADGGKFAGSKKAVPLENNPEAGFAKFPGVESDPVLRKQFENIDKRLKQSKVGTGGEVARKFKGEQFDLSPTQSSNVQRIQTALGLDKRNVRSFEDVSTLAQELGTDIKQLLKTTHSGQITDAEVAGISNLIKTNSDFITRQTKALDTATSTKAKEVLQGQIAQADAQIRDALKKLRIGNTENGRAIAANRILANKTTEPLFWYKKAERELSNHGGEFTPEIRTAIDDLIKKKDLNGLATFVASLSESSLTEKAITLWKAGLLTSPTTHMANVTGNTTMAALETVSDTVATGLDKIISIATGKRTKSASFTGVIQQVKGMGSGAKKGWKTLTTGQDLDTALGKYDIPKKTNFKNQILQKYTDTVFGALAAEDKIFKEGAMKASLFEQARVAALNQKLKGKDFDKAVKQLFENPTDEMVMEAIDVAEFRTFQSRNKLSDGIASFKAKQGPVGKAATEVIAPFTKTPTNVAARILDYSPAGFIKTIVEQINPATRSQKRLVEGLSRNITGTGVIALGGVLAANGMMTGNMPTSPSEKAQWELEGKQPNALKVGDSWVSLNRISPVGNLLALGAEIQKLQADPANSGLDVVAGGAAAGLKGLTEQTFLKGVSGGLKAVQEPDRYGASFVENTVASVVPSVVTRGARMIDPTVRKPDGVVEAVKARLPVLSKDVAPKRNVFGEELKYNALGQAIDPFNSRAASNDPTVKELRRLGGDIISQPSTSFGSLKLTGQELDVYLKKVGEATKKKLESGMNKDSYSKLSDEKKREAVEKAITETRKEYRAKFIAHRIAKELSAAQTRKEQSLLWQLYKKDGTMTQSAEEELRKLIKRGKVPRKE